MFPKNTSLKVNGSFNKKYPLNIFIRLKDKEGDDSKDFIVNNELRSDAFSYKEEREKDGEDIISTEIIINEDVDFYCKKDDLENCSEAILTFKFMNKEK